MTTNSTRQIIVYALFSVLFLCIPVVSSPDFSLDFSFVGVAPFQKSFLSTLSALLWFYLAVFWLIPVLWEKRRRFIFMLTGLFFFVLMSMMELKFGNSPGRGPAMSPFPVPGHIPGQFFNQPPFKNSTGDYFRVLIPFMLATMSAFLLRIYKRNREMEQSAVKARLQELQYQLQPHFLFNTLNNLYALSITEPQKAPDAILKLAEILRILLQNDNREKVPLTEELSFCRKYIALQDLKFGNRMSEWDIYVQETDSKVEIAPFLIIPIIENVFKYGVTPGKESPLNIRITWYNNVFSVSTFNKKVNPPVSALVESNKNGLQKTKKRLDLIYGNRYKLDIRENDSEYELHLTIALL